MIEELKHKAASMGRRGERESSQRRSASTSPGDKAGVPAPLYSLYTDGVCRENPGPGGWAYVAVFDGEEYEESGEGALATDMRMELTAAIKGLEATEAGSWVVVYTNSQVVQQGMTTWIHKWVRNDWHTSNGQMVDNQDLWEKLWALNQERRVQWEWLHSPLAHSEDRDVQDRRVHALASTAMERAAGLASTDRAAVGAGAAPRLHTDEEQPTPVADEEQPTPVADEEQLAPVADEQLAPVAEEQLAPVAEEQLAPVAEEQLAPVADEGRAPVVDAGIKVDDEHRAPVTDAGSEEGKGGMEDQRLALVAECHTLEQRWDVLHNEVLRLDREWRHLMEAFSSMEARRNGGPPAWADGAATYFDLSTHAAQTSTLATEALQTCDRFARTLQRALTVGER